MSRRPMNRVVDHSRDMVDLGLAARPVNTGEGRTVRRVPQTRRRSVMSIWLGRSVSLTAAVFLGALLSGCAPSSAAMGDVGGAEANKSPAVESPLAMAPTQPALGDDAKSASPYQITIDNFAFNPQKLTVPIGAKVTWVNRDDVPHTATSTKKPRLFDSKTLDTD